MRGHVVTRQLIKKLTILNLINLPNMTETFITLFQKCFLMINNIFPREHSALSWFWISMLFLKNLVRNPDYFLGSGFSNNKSAHFAISSALTLTLLFSVIEPLWSIEQHYSHDTRTV